MAMVGHKTEFGGENIIKPELLRHREIFLMIRGDNELDRGAIICGFNNGMLGVDAENNDKL